MDNGLILNGNGNAVTAFSIPPHIQIPGNSNENSTIEPTENEALENGATDAVELSAESLMLAHIDINSVDPTTVEKVLEIVGPEPRELTDTFRLSNDAVTSTEDENRLGNSPTSAIREVVIDNATTGTENVIVTVANPNTFQPAEVQTVSEQDTDSTGVSALQTGQEGGEQPPVTPEPPSTSRTIEGAVVREPGIPAEEENIEPNAQMLENQANELTRINQIILASTGTDAANGNAPTAESSEILPDKTQNEQQTLLQNVGSQLAQIIPPASVISVLG